VGAVDRWIPTPEAFAEQMARVRELEAIDIDLRHVESNGGEVARLVRRRTVVLELIEEWNRRYAPGSMG
jgi:hypothetical protein